jgi:hypothetical protein
MDVETQLSGKDGFHQPKYPSLALVLKGFFLVQNMRSAIVIT